MVGPHSSGHDLSLGVDGQTGDWLGVGLAGMSQSQLVASLPLPTLLHLQHSAEHISHSSHTHTHTHLNTPSLKPASRVLEGDSTVGGAHTRLAPPPEKWVWQSSSRESRS